MIWIMALKYMCSDSIAFGNFWAFIAVDTRMKKKKIIDIMVIMFAIAVNDVDLEVY